MHIKTGLLAIATAVTLAAPAQAATVVNYSFEDTPGFNGSRNWQVYNSVEGWTTTGGAGIEIQSNATLPGIDAQDGDKYVELDSHGRSSNSRMTQMVQLDAGSYRLGFYYAPRTNRGNSNGIEYSVGDFLLGQVSGPNGDYAVQEWTHVAATFVVDTGGLFDLSFAATGRQDTLGGLIDTVSLSEVPVPASALLLLGGLGAFGAMRRKKA